MNAFDRSILRRTLWHLLLSLLVLVTISFVAVLFNIADYFDGSRTPGQIAAVGRLPWTIAVSLAAAAFSALQLRHHPLLSRQTAQWMIAAGWDGQQGVNGLCDRLHWSECLAVACFAATESSIQGTVSVLSLISWLSVRTLSFRGALWQHGEKWSMYGICFLGMLAAHFYQWPVVMPGLVLTVAVLLEQSQRRATLRWADRALETDTRLRPRLTVSESSQQRSLLIYQLRPDLADPRPGAAESLLIAGLVALWSYVWTSQIMRWVPLEQLGEYSELRRFLWQISAPVSAVPLIFLLVRRLSWFNVFRWNPSPGLRSRFLQRRILVWRYDASLLPFLLVGILMGVSALLPVGMPLQMAIFGGLCTLLLSRFGPNPADWQLTASATLNQLGTSAEQQRQLRLKSS